MRKTALIFVLSFLILGCRQNQAKRESNSTSNTKVFKIGVIQLMTNPGIDAIREGFLDEMKKLGYKESVNVEFIQENPEGDNSASKLLTKKFIRDECDLVFAITTPTAVSCMNEIKDTDIPLVFGAVTDPVSAGLVNSLESPGRNITGTSDRWPIKQQFQLLQSLEPDVKKIGVIYNPSEANSVATMKEIEEICVELNLEVVKAFVSQTSEVATAAKSLVNKCDAFYVSADNTVITAMQSIVYLSEEKDIPLLPGVSSNVEQGGFGTLGPNYFDVGVESAKIVNRILKGEKASEIPVSTAKKFEYYFNLKSAKESDVEIPDSLLEKATKVYK